jgi:hypothetical protein
LTSISGVMVSIGPRESRLLVAHDLFRKPLHTFRDHAVVSLEP